jgi:cysteinyl-tRNA synthetase
MSLRVYNTLTREKEIFQPVQPGKVGIYLCGPTVYKSPHIGHMVGPVIFDAIKRYLLFKGFDVTWVVNITDVDDKLIDAANKNSVPMPEVADKYTQEYKECLALLGIDTIDHFPKASEHIGQIIELCHKLIDKGFAYAAEGNVYFDVTRDEDYGKLSKRRIEEQEAGLRDVEGAGKRHPADFALWKSAKPGEPQWPSPWGPGRPGWHIECSAMSMQYLGETFDMHGGGMDLMFPHHENELAQSESCTGKPFARYWMHNGLTRIKTKLTGGEWSSEKMSKSIGNVVDARELIQQQGADLVRYFLLATHYRRPIEFSDEVLANARKALGVFYRLFERVQRLGGRPLPEQGGDMSQVSRDFMETEHADFARAVLAHRMRFLEMMDDDFNTAGAIAVMHELAGQINGHIERHNLEKSKAQQAVDAVVAAAITLKNLGLLLGLFRGELAPPAPEESGLTEQLMQLLITLRQQARKDKNYALADSIRKGLTDIGVTLEDRPDGTIWRKE